jgi:hypothetical protein
LSVVNLPVVCYVVSQCFIMFMICTVQSPSTTVCPFFALHSLPVLQYSFPEFSLCLCVLPVGFFFVMLVHLKLWIFRVKRLVFRVIPAMYIGCVFSSILVPSGSTLLCLLFSWYSYPSRCFSRSAFLLQSEMAVLCFPSGFVVTVSWLSRSVVLGFHPLGCGPSDATASCTFFRWSVLTDWIFSVP